MTDTTTRPVAGTRVTVTYDGVDYAGTTHDDGSTTGDSHTLVLFPEDSHPGNSWNSDGDSWHVDATPYARYYRAGEISLPTVPVSVGDRVSFTLYDGTHTGTAREISGDSTLVSFESENPFAWHTVRFLPDTHAFWVTTTNLTAVAPDVPEWERALLVPEPVAEVSPEQTRIAELEARVRELITAREETSDKFRATIEHIGECLKGEAENRSYCHEFEDSVDEMCRGLSYPWDEVLSESAKRSRSYRVEWTISGSSYVTADSAEEAQEMVENGDYNTSDVDLSVDDVSVAD